MTGTPDVCDRAHQALTPRAQFWTCAFLTFDLDQGTRAEQASRCVPVELSRPGDDLSRGQRHPETTRRRSRSDRVSSENDDNFMSVIGKRLAITRTVECL